MPENARTARFDVESSEDMDGLRDSSLMRIKKVTGGADKKFRRTTMGEYIIRPGQKALTALAAINPGPNAYSPEKVLSSAPQYSMPGRNKDVRVVSFPVGPSDHPTTGNLKWKRKTISLKGKGLTFLELLAKSQNIGKDPPTLYNVERYKTGTNSPKWSFAGKSTANVQPGPLQKFVDPCEIPGFETPGPNYLPETTEKGGKSFGAPYVPEHLIERSPGPAHYTIQEGPQGLAYSFQPRRPSPKSSKVPSAAHYTLNTTLGRNGVRKSFGIRHAKIEKKDNPAPNMYVLPKQFTHDNAFQFTFRPFPYELALNVPSPAVYEINQNSTKPSAPEFSFKDKLKPTYPDILGYPEVGRDVSEPGPAEYDDKTKTVETNHAPKYSMGGTRRKSKNSNPGPNHYHLRTSCRPDSKKAPSFSFGYKNEVKFKQDSPGPASYNPSPTGAKSGGWTMTGRTSDIAHTDSPGPNAYLVVQRDTRRGPSLRSRPSPYVYSGINPLNVVDA